MRNCMPIPKLFLFLESDEFEWVGFAFLKIAFPIYKVKK